MASCSESTFLLSAADVSWGRRECFTVKINDAAAALGGEYWLLDVPSENFGTSDLYYVWFNLDAGSVDPAVAGRTGIAIAVTTGELASDVALAMQAVLEAHADIRAKICSTDTTGATVLVEAEWKGAVDNAAVDGDSGVTITSVVTGLGGDLGKTSGGVEVSMETQSVQITSDQTGSIVLDEVYTGQTVEATMSLLEMTEARWESIVASVVGDTYTPSGGTKLIGFGESRLYQSFVDLGGELVLHPSRLAATDRSKDIVLWKSAPKPGTINFSGEEPQTMEVTFTALIDKNIQTSINLMAFGDNQQDVRA